MENLKGKSPSETALQLSQVMLPEDANSAGNVHGGTIMKLVDNAAYVVAVRHSRKNCVTLAVDSFKFLYPVYVGELLIIKASINYAGRTSMEIGVRVEAEHLITGSIRHTASAYLTFVALGKDGRPVPVPPVLPETEDEKRRLQEAEKRRQMRLKLLSGLKNERAG
jgi:acyl-CoA hydrolase